MKKSFLTLIPALAIIALAATSCADRCCTKSGATDICESDLGSAASYDAVVALNEANGYSCD